MGSSGVPHCAQMPKNITKHKGRMWSGHLWWHLWHTRGKWLFSGPAKLQMDIGQSQAMMPIVLQGSHSELPSGPIIEQTGVNLGKGRQPKRQGHEHRQGLGVCSGSEGELTEPPAISKTLSHQGATQNAQNRQHRYQKRPSPLDQLRWVKYPVIVCWIRADNAALNQGRESIGQAQMLQTKILCWMGGAERWKKAPRKRRQKSQREVVWMMKEVMGVGSGGCEVQHMKVGSPKGLNLQCAEQHGGDNPGW